MEHRREKPKLQERMEALRLEETGDGNAVRGCAWPECAAEGIYPAPRDKSNLRTFIWLCLDHVRDYNNAWNYFAGMSEAEIAAHLRADVTWHRPSWRFGSMGFGGPEMHDPFGFFDEDADDTARAREQAWRRHGGVDERTARMMETLGVEPGFTQDELKQRYKILVKRHHPDLHAGDREAEERLKLINEAYGFLRKAHAAAG